jgi:hypothetical protein
VEHVERRHPLMTLRRGPYVGDIGYEMNLPPWRGEDQLATVS